MTQHFHSTGLIAETVRSATVSATVPEKCPECGGPWTRGYIIAQGRAGFSRGRRNYKWALVCENPGCGLGKFIGFEIPPDETAGLKLFAFNNKPKGEPMAPDEGTKKRWAEGYDACLECGGTEQPHSSKGLCKRCDGRRRYREKRTSEGAVKRRKHQPAEAASADNGTAVRLSANVYATVARLAAAFGCTPDEAVTTICRNYLTEIGVNVDAHGR